MIRLYKDSNDPNSIYFISKAEWESTIEHNITTSESIKSVIDMFFTIVREERFDLLKNCWDKYSFKLKKDGIETPHWYLIKGFVERKFESDNKALDTWRDGVSVFNNDIGLLMNLAKVEEDKESLSTFEKIFELGDFSEESVALYFHRYSDVNGQDKTIQRFEDFYKKYWAFEFINMNAFKLFEQDKDEFLNYSLRFFDDSKTLNPLYWAGRIADLMGELNRKKELILFLQKFVDHNCQDLGIHWNWAYATFLEGDETKAINHLNSLLKEQWLSIPDKETVLQQIDFLKKEN